MKSEKLERWSLKVLWPSFFSHLLRAFENAEHSPHRMQLKLAAAIQLKLQCNTTEYTSPESMYIFYIYLHEWGSLTLAWQPRAKWQVASASDGFKLCCTDLSCPRVNKRPKKGAWWAVNEQRAKNHRRPAKQPALCFGKRKWEQISKHYPRRRFSTVS